MIHGVAFKVSIRTSLKLEADFMFGAEYNVRGVSCAPPLLATDDLTFAEAGEAW